MHLKAGLLPGSLGYGLNEFQNETSNSPLVGDAESRQCLVGTAATDWFRDTIEIYSNPCFVSKNEVCSFFRI